jgi:hypothetical protein
MGETLSSRSIQLSARKLLIIISIGAFALFIKQTIILNVLELPESVFRFCIASLLTIILSIISVCTKVCKSHGAMHFSHLKKKEEENNARDENIF